MASYIHFTSDEEFRLDPGHQHPWDPEPGIYVYAAAEYDAVAPGWPGRRCVDIEAPEGVALFVQSFTDEELPGEPGFTEFFIPAREFARCDVEEE